VICSNSEGYVSWGNGEGCVVGCDVVIGLIIGRMLSLVIIWVSL
jgi:hypothetical protein